MCLDPVTPVVCLLLWIECLRIFHDRTKEWPAYEKSLKDVAAFLSDLDSDYKQLMSRRLIIGSWEVIACEIKDGKSLLEKARKVVDWDGEASTGLKTGSVKFAFKYANATKNKEHLTQCLEKLQKTREKIDELKTILKARDAYLLERHASTFAALARQYRKLSTPHTVH